MNILNLDWEPWVGNWNNLELIPGMYVKLDTGHVYLIGDLNKNGGLCNCCTPFLNNNIVAYALQEINW